MPSLCFAIAAQLSAFLLSSMPMHPKQNLAAAALALSSPFRCRSYPVDATPLLFLTFLRFAIPLPSCQRFAFASRCRSMPCSASPCSAFALHRRALPSPCLSVLLSAAAPPCSATALHQSTRINALAARNHSQPCHCHASSCTASANQGRQCHALALSPSPHRRCK